MRKIICILVAFTFLGCSHTDDKLCKYIKSHCDFKNSDTCYIDLQKVLGIDYDTMYMFGEYTVVDVMRNIIGIEEYGSKHPNAVSVKDSYHKIILLKDHQIIYEDDFMYSRLDIKKGMIIEKKGIFDGDTITDRGYLYTSPIFRVIKKKLMDQSLFYTLESIP